MARSHSPTIPCIVCGKEKVAGEIMPAAMVRGPVAETIRERVPAWSSTAAICMDDLHRFRAFYVEDVMEQERGEVSTLESAVVTSLREHEVLAKNINVDFERARTLGERLADRIATFGGSWAFLLSFALVLLVWITINSIALLGRPFDPYPYILLNLVLSCLAAIQAPVIMMSQNRQEAKDRLRAEHDYQVNLKAELEIRHLNGKMDLLLSHQWHRLIEIQQVQIDMMQELMEKQPSRSPPTRTPR